MNALFHRSDALFKGHIMAEIVIENGVDKVCCIPVSSFGNLLKGSEIVHPVELCFSSAVLEPANEAVHLIGCTTKCISKLGPHVLS